MQKATNRIFTLTIQNGWNLYEKYSIINDIIDYFTKPSLDTNDTSVWLYIIREEFS